MKKLLLLISFIMFTTFFSGCSSNDAQNTVNNSNQNSDNQEVITLTYGENQKENYPTTIAAKEFAARIKEKTNGRIKINVVANGELGDELELIQKVQKGEIDLTRSSISSLTNYSPELNVLTLPYLYRNSEHMWKVLNGEFGEGLLKRLVNSANVIGLSWFESGSRSFYTIDKPITSPSDLNGLKIRVQNNPMSIDMIKLLGAEPSLIGYNETLSALENKAIDGAENSLPSYESEGHYTAAKYYTFDEHTRIPEMVIMNAKLYNSLSPNDKIIIKEAAIYASDIERDLWNKKEEKALSNIKKAGCVINKIDNSSEFQKVVMPLYEKYAKDNMDLVNKIQEIE